MDHGARQRARILLVDDHPENLMALRSFLTRPDYELVECTSGGDALKKILKYEFALILLDVVMPGLDGLETARIIRQREASKNIPILFLTAAGAEMGQIYKAYSVGAVDYLVKPIEPDIVKAKVAVFVELWRKEGQIRAQEAQLRESERRRSEQALKESDALYEATFDKAAVGIAHMATDGQWLRANQKLADVVGYTRGDLVQLRIQDLTHPDDVEETVGDLRRLLSGEIETLQDERRYRHRDGRTIWVWLTVSLLKDDAGRPRQFVVIVEDITERRLMANRRQFLTEASETLLSSFDDPTTLARVGRLAVPAVADWCMVDLAPAGGQGDPIVIVHAAGIQAGMLEQWALGEQDGRRVRLADFLRDGQPVLLPQLPTAWTSGHELVSPELVAATSVLVVPVVARDEIFGTIAFGVSSGRRYGPADLAMAEDLAHRVSLAVDNARLYREARDAVSARDEFLSIASHELRTPLTPLQIVLQRLLSERSKEPLETISTDRLRLLLARSERQVQRLTALVDNLLDVSRVSSGTLRLQREECDLAEVVNEVVGRFGEECARAECQVTIEAPPRLIGQWDPLRIEQVITNLLANAIKYGAGKPILIHVEGGEGSAQIVVKDHGIGIEPEKVSRIFERFERAVSSRSYGGLGLGLYIARQIVDAHGGRISVNSRPGEGSTFTIDLPLEHLTLLRGAAEDDEPTLGIALP
jgi:PAS domain S-box-containing protein